MFEGAGRDRAGRKRFQGAVQTDLVLSSAVAQFGRSTGMIQATAAEVISQFAANLRGQIPINPAA
jgi:hypothetical protein